MFTGIIQAVGQVSQIQAVTGGDWRLGISVGKLDMSDVQLGDSIAVNGVCLTVVEMTSNSFIADVSNETLTISGIAGLTQGSRVNLEKALRLADRLGGHLVSGHVDGVGQVSSITADGRSWRYVFGLPEILSRYVSAKGSITINGVSLTVNGVGKDHFEVNLVPHTLQETNLEDLAVGSQVNLEVDVIARYLERLLQGGALSPAEPSRLTPEFLAQNGFWK
jgi:riboflavin synthase